MIVVGEGYAHSFAADLSNACVRRHVRKGSIPVVVVKRIGKRGVILGMAVGAHIRTGSAKRVLVDLPLAIVRHEQVQAAVVIVIEPAGGHRPHLLSVQRSPAYSGFVRNIGKGAVVVVMKKLIPGHIGEEDIRPSVVIVISNGDADAITLAFDSGFLRNIGESAVVVIMEKTVPILGRLFLQRWNGRAVDEV